MDGGLSIDWAGKSTESLNLNGTSIEAQTEFWKRRQDWIDNNTDYNANAKGEQRRPLAYHRRNMEQRIAELKARNERVEERIAEISEGFDKDEADLDFLAAHGQENRPEYREAIRLGREIIKR